jgi:hypothetical protein
MRSRPRLTFCILPVLLLLALFSPPRAGADEVVPPGPTDKEIRIGDKAAEDLEKDPKVKLLDASDAKNKALLDKLNKMAEVLGKASARPQIKYTVKVIDDKDVNAFTLPNGHIYVYKGLLDFVASDDELAGVLAHEIGHNARMHALRGDAKASKLSWAGLAAMAAMLAGGTTGANVAAFAPYLLTGIMNGYTEDYEKEADAAAITEMAKTKYNPSAMVTFMERLAYQENRRPEIQLGIYRTHPPSPERAAAALADLQAAGIPYTPRAVSGGGEAVVVEEKDRVLVKFEEDTLLTFAPGAGAEEHTAVKERAQAAATHINELLRAGLKMYELTTSGDATGARLTGRGIEIARIMPADARLINMAPPDAARNVLASFRKLFWRESVNGKM